MIFNSIDFAIFLPLVFVLYWFALRDTIKGQNILLLVASYFFYGYWDVYFLLLIALSTLVDYYIGHRLYQAEHLPTRKFLLGISIFVNIGILVFF